METAAECYAMADHCEKQAAEVVSPEARRIFQEVAVKWRALGDSLKAEEGTTRRIVPGCTEQQLKTLLAISQGKVHRDYVDDPAISDLVQLKLVAASDGAYLEITDLGRVVLATKPSE